MHGQQNIESFEEYFWVKQSAEMTTLKTTALRYFKTSGTTHPTTERLISEEPNVHVLHFWVSGNCMRRLWETRVKRWRQKAVDREEWESAIQESKALQGHRAKNKVKYDMHGISASNRNAYASLCNHII